MSSSNDSKPDNFHVNARICSLVSRYPCMYDRSHQFYLKKDVVDRAWLKIAKEMDDSIPSCKERWRNIRTSFARSINVNKIPASANRTKPYYLHKELQFLARHITPGIPVSRRSNNNAYYSAGEESEVIEVSVGEESFDGFAQMVQNNGVAEELDEEEHEESVSEEEPQSSVEDVVVEGNNNIIIHNNNNNEFGFSGGITKDEQQQQQPTPVVTLQKANLVHARDSSDEDDEGHEAEPTVPQPLPVLAIICPPKKRQRLMAQENDEEDAGVDVVKDMSSLSAESEPQPEPEHDVKPNISLNADADFDAVFLQNLLPEMKAMNFRQKLIFKRRIYEVIGDIFEAPATQQPETATAATTTSSAQATLHYVRPKRLVSPSPASIAASPAAAATAAAATSTMTVVNAADLAMIRRLNSLLQSPNTGAASSTTVTAVPKNIASISSTVRSTPPPATATVAVHRGALTRSNAASMLRVTMVNAPSSSTCSSSASPAVSSARTPSASAYVSQFPHVIKLEHDDAESVE